MPLNYAKWDALEASDDSDTEPVEKPTGCTCTKEQKMYQEQEERRVLIENLKREESFNATLQEHVRKLLVNTEKEGVKHARQVLSKLEADGHLEPLPSPSVPITPERVFCNLIWTILQLVKETRPVNEGAAVAEELKVNLDRLVRREEERKVELLKEESKARNHNVTPLDVHDGFDVSHVNKMSSTESKSTKKEKKDKSKSTKKGKKDSAPKTGGGASTSGRARTGGNANQNGQQLPQLTPSARRFSQIEASDYPASFSAIQRDRSLFEEAIHQDAILVEALQLEMQGRKTEAKNCVHQGLLLKHCRQQLNTVSISNFFRKLRTGEPSATSLMVDDVDLTYDDIVGRVALLNRLRAGA